MNINDFYLANKVTLLVLTQLRSVVPSFESNLYFKVKYLLETPEEYNKYHAWRSHFAGFTIFLFGSHQVHRAPLKTIDIIRSPLNNAVCMGLLFMTPNS